MLSWIVDVTRGFLLFLRNISMTEFYLISDNFMLITFLQSVEFELKMLGYLRHLTVWLARMSC